MKRIVIKYGGKKAGKTHAENVRKKLEKKKKQIPQYSNKCKGCGFTIHESENYCGECMCEDDCGY